MLRDKKMFIFYGILAIGFVVILVSVISYAKNPLSGSKNFPSSSQIANPASVYCEEQGGKLEIRDKKDGQKGFCVFNDGSECEEWAFWRGECKKGEKICKDLCGNGTCEEIVCMAVGCPCAETAKTCPEDCR
jgi:putative hemolysin